MLKLYENIKIYREKLNMTQEELGFLCGYTRSSISKIEKGLVDLSFAKICIFAKNLDVEPWILIGWDFNSVGSRADLLLKLINDDDLSFYANKINNLPVEKKINVYNYIDFVEKIKC